MGIESNTSRSGIAVTENFTIDQILPLDKGTYTCQANNIMIGQSAKSNSQIISKSLLIFLYLITLVAK